MMGHRHWQEIQIVCRLAVTLLPEGVPGGGIRRGARRQRSESETTFFVSVLVRDREVAHSQPRTEAVPVNLQICSEDTKGQRVRGPMP